METIIGNITDIDRGVIVHQVNCLGVMNAGVGAAIRVKWPHVYDEYSRLLGRLDSKGALGCVQFVEVADGLEVANSFSQYSFGDARKTGVRYTDMNILVGNLAYVCQERPDARVYIPYGIGCGQAGGDWKAISAAIGELPLTAVRYIP